MSGTPDRLPRAALGVPDIVFFVVAAAAPLGATLANAPLVYAAGGKGAPALYLIASIALFLFAIGFAAVSRHVVGGGGFAEIIARGLGRPAGNAGAGIALLAYSAMGIGIYAQFALFTAEAAKDLAGIDLDWRVLIFAAVGLIGLFGYREIKLSAKLLGVVMILEVLILILFDVMVIIGSPVDRLEFAGVGPDELFTSGAATGLMFAFACFVGFESTAIYGEEARDPERTIPMATYIAIGFIGIFYTVTMWCIGTAHGDSDVVALAAADPINFVFKVNTLFVGAWSTSAMRLLVLASLFAVLLSFHNALSRYAFELGRSGFLSRSLGRIHSRFASPYRASLLISAFMFLAIGGFVLGGADPMKHIFLWMVALGTLGVLVMQALAAFGIVGVFARRRERLFWRGFVAPAAGGIALSAVVYLAVANFHLLSGAETRAVSALPWLVLLAGLAGMLRGKIASGS